MDYELNTKDSESPVMITIDPDNGIYTIRKSDTSGEVFNNAKDLLNWYEANMEAGFFHSEADYKNSLQWINSQVNQEI